MFTNARIKLTAWYLLIIMIVGLLFSVVIYRVVTKELEQGFLQAENHLRSRERMLRISAPPEIRQSLTQDFQIARDRVLIWLLVINGFILILSAAASFALAGKTLAPIAETLEEQKRFVTDASHELHTPLTALKTSIEVALRDKKLTTEGARKVLGESLEEVNELGSLSENLLSLAHLEKNGHSTVSRVDLADVVRQVAKRLKPLADKKRITLSVKTDLGVFAIDETSFSKLLTILIDNAIKYTKEFGTVSVTSSTKKSQLELVVSDTGIGIAKKDLIHIFDRFYRADTSRTKEGSTGFGLGLAIAKRIVVLQGGTITVTSKLNKGTTFTVFIPLSS